MITQLDTCWAGEEMLLLTPLLAEPVGERGLRLSKEDEGTIGARAFSESESDEESTARLLASRGSSSMETAEGFSSIDDRGE
jgi:hypothetical protein